METVKDVKDALSARSRTATLEQLASEGRKKVRLIKAEHVAAMIHAAVHSAIDGSGLDGNRGLFETNNNTSVGNFNANQQVNVGTVNN